MQIRAEQNNLNNDNVNQSEDLEKEYFPIEDDQEKMEGHEQNESSEVKFLDGQLLTLIRIRFPGNAKSFPFLIGKRKFEYGRKVLAMSDRGVAVGYINSFPYQVPFDKSMLPLRNILKIATDQDVDKDSQHYSREREAKELCKDLITKHNLDMELTHVEYTQFGKKAVFYFTSPARVDFRNLVKDLLNQLKMRIELRQIGWRDRTAAIGGIGPCGRQLCCNSFLSKYGNVSLKMAKNQNLTLNPGRLNGVCGQLKCCIQYEDEVYQEKTSRLPALGKFIMVINGDKGKVEKHHILVEQFELITDEGKRRRYSINQYNPELKLPEHWKFPTQFEHIINETDSCIGLEKKELDKTTQHFLKNIIGPHGLPMESDSSQDSDFDFQSESTSDHEEEIDSDSENENQNENENDHDQHDQDDQHDDFDHKSSTRPTSIPNPPAARSSTPTTPGRNLVQGQDPRPPGDYQGKRGKRKRHYNNRQR